MKNAIIEARAEKRKEQEAGRWQIVEKAEAVERELQPFYKKMLRTMLKAEENRVFSPLNLFLALSSLAAGAAGRTLEQILALVNAKDEKALRKAAKLAWEANAVAEGEAFCSLATSVWLKSGLLEFYNKKTIEILQKTYMADVFIGEMGSPELTAAAQKWLNEATGGKLQNEVSGVEFEKETALALIAAIHLKANWESEFEERHTKPRGFHGELKTAKVDTMFQQLRTSFYAGKTFKALAMELSCGASACFVLPHKTSSVDEVLSGDELFELLALPESSWETVEAKVYLPKFEARAKFDLGAALSSLGVADAFDMEKANFKNFADLPEPNKLYVSGAVHAAMFEVKEKGVEGAAFTAFCMALGCLPPAPARPVVFRLDRPFLYAVQGADKALLFAGAVRNLE